jgi:hypothetical protein
MFFVSQNLRYFSPVFPLIAVICGWFFSRFTLKTAFVLPFTLITTSFLITIWGANHFYIPERLPLRAAFGLESREQFYARVLPAYDLYTKVQEDCQPGSSRRVLSFTSASLYLCPTMTTLHTPYLRGIVWGQMTDDERYVQFRKNGIESVIVDPSFKRIDRITSFVRTAVQRQKAYLVSSAGSLELYRLAPPGPGSGKERIATFGQAGDLPVVGNWDGSGAVRWGVFRGGSWLLDGRGGSAIAYGQAGDLPITGKWTAGAATQIGVFRKGDWLLYPSLKSAGRFGEMGDLPITGDWNGSGITKVGVFRNGAWFFDTNGNFAWDTGDQSFQRFGQAGDHPLIGDWDGTGKWRIGVYRAGTVFLDINGNGEWDSNDRIIANAGQAGDIAVVGDGPILYLFRKGEWYRAPL